MTRQRHEQQPHTEVHDYDHGGDQARDDVLDRSLRQIVPLFAQRGCEIAFDVELSGGSVVEHINVFVAEAGQVGLWVDTLVEACFEQSPS
jgi:hypothetical protein